MIEDSVPAKKEIVTNFDKDWELWDKSDKESFLYINNRSCPFPDWLSFQQVLKNPKHNNSILKPINEYVSRLYPPPSLVSITDNKIVLRQGNHAEIFLLIKDDGSFYNVDRPWIRQYYKSSGEYDLPEDCFDGMYRFYVPWTIDADVTIKIVEPSKDSPFHIYETNIRSTKIPSNIQSIEPPFVNFHFKKVGSHMIDDSFGKIRRQSPMFDIEIETNDIIVLSSVRKFYERQEHH